MRKPKPAGAMTNEDEDIIDIYYCEMCQDSGCLECASEQDKANVELPTIIAKQDERIKSLKAKLRAQAGVIEKAREALKECSIATPSYHSDNQDRPCCSWCRKLIERPLGIEDLSAHHDDCAYVLANNALSLLTDAQGKEVMDNSRAIKDIVARCDKELSRLRDDAGKAGE